VSHDERRNRHRRSRKWVEAMLEAYNECSVGPFPVTGLSIARQLRRTRPTLKLTILARDLPSDQDYSQSFGSVWAGADWSAFATSGSLEAKWESQTYNDWLSQTQKNGVPSELVAFVEVEKHVEKDEKGLWSKPWWKDVVKDVSTFNEEKRRNGFFDDQSVYSSKWKQDNKIMWVSCDTSLSA
jgi:hypothetical protein